MADRYWVGGTANWDGTAGTKWATTSGGAGGASVPTTADDVFFDANSGAAVVSITTGNTGAKSINCTGFTGTFATGGNNITVAGSITLSASMTYSYIYFIYFTANATITSAGKTFNNEIILNSAGINVQLADAFVNLKSVTFQLGGTLTTNNYNCTVLGFTSSTASSTTLAFGTSAVTITGTTGINAQSTTWPTVTGTTYTITYTSTASYNVISSTSATGAITLNNITLSSTVVPSVTFNGNLTTNDLTLKPVSAAVYFEGNLTCNNLSVDARTTAGISSIYFRSNKTFTINGTLSVTAGATPAYRTALVGSTFNDGAIGLTTATLSCNAVAALTDVDFSGITITGNAISGGNITGTRLGDGKGNTNITFGAPKTVYYRGTGSSNWSDSTSWSATLGGASDVNSFPLAQDTASLVDASYPASGSTVTFDAPYFVGTLDLGRTSGAVTFATGTNTVYSTGDVTANSAYSFTGTGGYWYFIGRGNQTLTSNGRTFTMPLRVFSNGGTLTLGSSFTSTSTGQTYIAAGTVVTNSYTLTLNSVAVTGWYTGAPEYRAINMGSGNVILSGSGTVFTGTSFNNSPVIISSSDATLSPTSASAKTMSLGGLYYPCTIDHNGAGQLTLTGTGSKIRNIKNTYIATAANSLRFTSGSTYYFDQWQYSGVLGRVCTVTSTSVGQSILVLTQPWMIGINSTIGASITNMYARSGLSVNYLSVSYLLGRCYTNSFVPFFGA